MDKTFNKLASIQRFYVKLKPYYIDMTIYITQKGVLI